MHKFSPITLQLKTSFFLLLLICFASCNTRLNKVTAKNNEIEITKYELSDITAGHDFIEVRKGASAIKIMEANAYGFTDLLISNDTIVIQYLPNHFYYIAKEVFNYKIKLDTSISVDYYQQKVNQRESTKK